MEYIVFDSETTGLEPYSQDGKQNHRVIELAAIKIRNGNITNEYFHEYINNAGKMIDEGAKNIHGITEDFLRDKPRFEKIAGKFIDFIQGGILVAHNARFDMKFLRAEFEWAKLKPIDSVIQGVVDTLEYSRDAHPGHRNTLDALCDRYQVDRSQRDLHGALIDTRLLAEAFLSSKIIHAIDQQYRQMQEVPREKRMAHIDKSRQPRIILPSAEEQAIFQKHLEGLRKASKNHCLWDTQNNPSPSNS